MSDVNVKRQQQQSTESRGEQQSMEQRGRQGLARTRGWDPFSFSLMPAEFFGTDPFSFMRRFHSEMDRLMGRQAGAEGGRGMMTTWNPSIEVAERGGQLHVIAELPGLRPEDVKVELTDDALIIQGERKHEETQEKGGMFRSERQYGHFFREIPLPEGVNAQQAKAQFRDGVLEITMPVPEHKENRRSIPIESGAASARSASEKK